MPPTSPALARLRGRAAERAGGSVGSRRGAVAVLLAVRLPLLLAVLLLADRLELLLPGLVVFVVAESLVLWKVWPARQRARLSEAERHGQLAVQAEKERTDRIRSDLIATVSHEFRTPLTGIRGAALTLLKRGDRLEPSARAHLLRAVLDQEERLSRLLENMLVAAEATSADPDEAAEVDAVVAEVVMLAGARRPECPPAAVAVEPGTVARIGRQALHQVLANLVDNAQQHGHPQAVPLVAAGRDGLGVWITVSNEGTTLDTHTARMLFEPFTQADSGTTRAREGLGLGLYVVRRLVEVHRGSILLRSEAGWTTVEVRLSDAAPAGGPSTRKAFSPEPSAVPRTLPREALVR